MMQQQASMCFTELKNSLALRKPFIHKNKLLQLQKHSKQLLKLHGILYITSHSCEVHYAAFQNQHSKCMWDTYKHENEISYTEFKISAIIIQKSDFRLGRKITAPIHNTNPENNTSQQRYYSRTSLYPSPFCCLWRPNFSEYSILM